ncbi:fibronectin type III-like domain-contianing protein, partial [Bacillus thuringiensis]
SKYLDIPNEPLLPFGFGLSYTTFAYSDASLSATSMSPGGSITVSVKVKNIGNVAGDEIVQLYVRDVVGEVIRPLKELKDFKKIILDPDEEKEVMFILKEEQLHYHHSDLQ